MIAVALLAFLSVVGVFYLVAKIYEWTHLHTVRKRR